MAEAVETVEKGELYVVNDQGERKATGAYYTPDYVVTYIVEETVGPLLSEIEAELAGMDMDPGTQRYVVAFWKRVTNLKILDPAMGSGHFLTKATGYLADAVMERVRELETGTLFDEEQVRREISKECIYGVDINGMAVELAKLSMWLETLAADQPLAFLDHHLKTGNSLVGSDITTVLAEDEGESGQVTLAYDFAQTRQRALNHVMDLTGELLAIDNETLEDIHSMEDLYEDIRADPLYQRLFSMATVHTANQFGLDVPDDADERMARAIEDDNEWAKIEATDWFHAARVMAYEEGFFHWELEFPAVFFDSDGERLASAGFDAVVGNPPYITFRDTPDSLRNYTRDAFSTFQMKGDVYVLFIEQASELLKQDGYTGYIVQNKFMTAGYGESLRRDLAENETLHTIIDFHDSPVFEITAYPLILVRQKTPPDENHLVDWHDVHTDTKSDAESSLNNLESERQIKQSELGSEFWHPFAGDDSFEQETIELQSICEQIGKGAVSGNTSVYLVSNKQIREHDLERDFTLPVLRGGDVDRYAITSDENLTHLIYPYDTNGDSPEVVDKDKIPNIISYLENFRSELEERKNYGNAHV